MRHSNFRETVDSTFVYCKYTIHSNFRETVDFFLHNCPPTDAKR